jgi:hypothetical protein
MAEAVLTRRSVVKNESQLLADITVSGSAVTQIDITSLNLVKGEEYVLVSDIYNPTATGSDYSLFTNANYTSTNYYRQYLIANGTSISAGRINDGAFTLANNGYKSFCITKIKLTNNGYVVHQSNTIQRYNEPSNYHIYDVYGTSTFTVASITSLRISGSVASSIGIGSRFQLYKVGA